MWLVFYLKLLRFLKNITYKLFTADNKGFLIEWNLNILNKDNTQVNEKDPKNLNILIKEKNWGKVLGGSIYSMALSNNNEFLI